MRKSQDKGNAHHLHFLLGGSWQMTLTVTAIAIMATKAAATATAMVSPGTAQERQTYPECLLARRVCLLEAIEHAHNRRWWLGTSHSLLEKADLLTELLLIHLGGERAGRAR